jgi:hypothetical protein
MRILAVIIVVAVIYFLITKMGPVTSVSNAVKEADAVTRPIAPATPAATPCRPASAKATPQSSGIRRPIDRTRAVLKQVGHRHAGN